MMRQISQQLGTVLSDTSKYFADQRNGRIWSVTNTDLAFFAVLSVAAGLIGLIALLYMLILHRDAITATALSTAVAGLGALGAVVAYCWREANKRVTSLDVFIGDIQAQLAQIYLVLHMAETRNLPDEELARGLRCVLQSLDSTAFEAMTGRLDDLLRMPVRYITAYYAEVRTARARLTPSPVMPEVGSEEILLFTYKIWKRGLRAVGNLAERSEKAGFLEYKQKVETIASRLARVAKQDDIDHSLYLRYGLLLMTKDDVKAMNERQARHM